jgi:hypothetical protein
MDPRSAPKTLFETSLRGRAPTVREHEPLVEADSRAAYEARQAACVRYFIYIKLPPVNWEVRPGALSLE